MSQGHVVRSKNGKQHPDRLYIQLKNSSVWVYEKPLDLRQQQCVVQGIEQRLGKVKLRHWIKVR